MGILLCEQHFRDVWRRNKSVRAEIGNILRTHTHAAKLVVRIEHGTCFTCTSFFYCINIGGPRYKPPVVFRRSPALHCLMIIHVL